MNGHYDGFAEHPAQSSECKPLTMKPVHLPLDLSKFVKHISLDLLRQKMSDS